MKISKTAAEREKLAFWIAAIPDTLIFPFPNRAAHQRGIFVEDVVVVALDPREVGAVAEDEGVARLAGVGGARVLDDALFQFLFEDLVPILRGKYYWAIVVPKVNR